MKASQFACNLIFWAACLAGDPASAQSADGKSGRDKPDSVILKEYDRWSQMRADWPGFGRYRDSNAALATLPVPADRVVFMGNSITDGWIGQSPDFFYGNHYVDRGISGQTTPQMLVRFRADVVALRPKVVVMLCGINDIAGNTGPTTNEMIEDNIASMTELATASGIKVVLCSILPAYDFPWRPNTFPTPRIKAVNAWIKAYAASKHHLYVDYFPSFADEREGMKKEYSEDGVHPNKAGYTLMEQIVSPAIRRALGK